MSLDGRVYTITGAASGIGQAVAIRLAELGAAGLAISDLNLKGLEETKNKCSKYNAKVTVTKVDVSQNDQINGWIEATLGEFGRLDGAANVAGIAGGDGETTCATIKTEDWDQMLNVNLRGVMFCMRAQLPHLRSGGAIVNVSSTSGLRGLPHNAAYATSKFGVIGLTESAAGEFGRYGIRVNSLLPGPIDTPIFRDGEAKGLFSSEITSQATCLGRMGKPNEVAKVLCFLLTDDASYVTGGQVGLVTGAGTPYGIGRSLVIQLAKAGAKAVYACDLNTAHFDALKEDVKSTGSDCVVEGFLLDVSSEEQTVALLKKIVKAHGRFDFFFANAGFANYRNLNDIQPQHWDRSISVMTTSCFYAIKYGSQAMAVTSQEKPQPGGSIVLTSSCAAFLGAYADISYTAAKKAVNALVESGSVQLSASNIRVNGFAPGFTRTSILTSSQNAEKGSEYGLKETAKEIQSNHEWFFERAGLRENRQYYYNRLQEAEEMAYLGVFLASDLASSINGQTILADSGFTAAATKEACTGPIPPVKPLELV
ncbi:hypothetical protein CDV55_101651 [Aspergillus turcosus]|nr:hypothetical protein CDV55_101651 [Aspergillus turcosus]